MQHGIAHAVHTVYRQGYRFMFAGIGIVVLLAMVFGGFIITGGAIGPVAEAIPTKC
jgi:hypothetical protein